MKREMPTETMELLIHPSAFPAIQRLLSTQGLKFDQTIWRGKRTWVVVADTSTVRDRLIAAVEDMQSASPVYSTDRPYPCPICNKQHDGIVCSAPTSRPDYEKHPCTCYGDTYGIDGHDPGCYHWYEQDQPQNQHRDYGDESDHTDWEDEGGSSRCVR